MKNKTAQDYFEKGEVLFAAENLEEIDVFIEECYRQGHAYFERGKEDIKYFHEAAKLFQYVFEFNPEYPDIYYHMGRAFYESNNKYQAYVAFKKLRMLNPNYKDASDNMKQIQEDLGIEEDSSNESDFQRITASIGSSYHDDMIIIDKRAFMFAFQKLQEHDEKLERHDERLGHVETRVGFLEKIAHITGAKLQATIDTAIKELETTGDKKLFLYYQKFYWTLQDVFDACRSISTELVVADGGQVERLSTTAARKFLCYFLDILSGIPLYGCIIGTIHDAVDNLHNTTLTKILLTKIEALNNITHSKFTSTLKVTQVLQQLAIIFTHLKKEESLAAIEVNEQKNALKTAVNFLKTKIFLLQEKACSLVGIKINNEEIDDNPVTKSAFQDATLLIGYLYDNSKSLINSGKKFIEEIIAITKQGQLSKIWLNNKIEQNSSIGIEYKLFEIESKVSDDIEVIHRKTLEGKWIATKVWMSWTGISRGIEDFLNVSYIKERFNTTPSDKQINDFRIFIFQEMCKAIADSNM